MNLAKGEQSERQSKIRFNGKCKKEKSNHNGSQTEPDLSETAKCFLKSLHDLKEI